MKRPFLAILLSVLLYANSVNSQSTVSVKQCFITDNPASSGMIIDSLFLELNDGVISLISQVDDSSKNIVIRDSILNLSCTLPKTHVYVLLDAIVFKDWILLEIRGIGKTDEPEKLYAAALGLNGIPDTAYGINGILDISNHIQVFDEEGFKYSSCPLMFTDNNHVYLENRKEIYRCDINFVRDLSFGNSGSVPLETAYGSAEKSTLTFGSNEMRIIHYDNLNKPYLKIARYSITGEFLGTLYVEK